MNGGKNGGTPKQRNKQQRIDNLGIQKSRLESWWQDSDKTDALVRIAMATVAAVALLALCLTWRPPFAFRQGSIPPRQLISRADFEVPDLEATEDIRRQERRKVLTFYRHRTAPLNQLVARLRDQLFLIFSAEDFDSLDENARQALTQFRGESDSPKLSDKEKFALLLGIRDQDESLNKLDDAVKTAMRNQYENGVLKSLQHEPSEGSQEIIQIYPENAPDNVRPLEVKRVRIAQAAGEIFREMRDQFRSRYDEREFKQYAETADLVSGFLTSKLPEFETLTYDKERSQQLRDEVAAAVPIAMVTYRAGESVLAAGGKPIDEQNLFLLRREWETLITKMSLWDRMLRVGAYAGMIIALYLLCSSYIYFVGNRRVMTRHAQLAKLLAVMVIVIAVGFWSSGRAWRTELVALTIGSILTAVVYGRELAMLLMAAACVSLTLFTGADVSELVVMAAACTSIVLLLGQIRTRTRLLSVGATSALITVLTVIGVGIVTGQTLSAGAIGTDAEPIIRTSLLDSVFSKLAWEAFLGGFAICAAAAAATPFLPLVEKAFGVQTDLSLLELGDASHPLLRRLAQRAPGTYNHSINVASMAEAAADEIGANGLLVRVGAYFHDIGKMFKPDYFIENQSAGENQHDTLQPAMSTLVIIAHVKDGADLARSHGLPDPIIDLIEQHHGTTLVEYFYREAARRSEEDPNADAVSDKDFRYPGPKPQTLEAAVMMLADTVESASRTLVDPTPARIRHLVDAIAEKKMNDGQFDDCGLTFRQLNRIRSSLVKSLTAIYHARVKYPGQPKSA